jgi:RimJ/RimL family protein N-acetyltransferase
MTEIKRLSSDEWRTVRKIRLAALKDSPNWFWATYDEEVDKPEAWWRDFIEAGAWFIAHEGDDPVGIAAAIRDPELDESDRQLISMWVVPEARNRGIGAGLVDAVMTWAREEGVQELQLQVTEDNHAAKHLYEQSGFRATGRAEPLARDPRLIEHEMRMHL